MSKTVGILYNHLEKENTQQGEYYKDVEMIEKAFTGWGYSVRRIEVNGDIRHMVSELTDHSLDYIFNLCEEINNDAWGEIYAAGILEMINLPYTGSGPSCLALSLNKARTKDILSSHGIMVPRYQVFESENIHIRHDLSFPVIAKPLCEDGSFGIESGSVANSIEELRGVVNMRLVEYEEPVIVEEYIKGREFNVAILGNDADITILPISEIDYSGMPPEIPKICTYNAKWEKESEEYKGSVPICPTKIEQGLEHKIKDTAVEAYKIMECYDYARVDFRVSSDNTLYVIDINPNPCISPDSGFVHSAKVAGMNYNDLIEKIFMNCQQRHKNGEHKDPGVVA